ncbi:hypothetical protein VE25_05625 [Devosia geojensis]|uniref:Uncharacterized protein n=1 Tax=Devosia geojensis TaxID=443610 RepID=A0A0F5FVX6_9HYPH|nr:hypothetical protein [Devosia geojensis]KKB12715.1 hypothetical protein VE25_05625 [Devosia geojensis]
MPHSQKKPTGGRAKSENVDFLVDRFGIASPKAAGLVADDESEADTLSSEKNAREHRVDDLADAPVPEEARSDHIADSDEDALKPVLHNRKG